jgi:glyoxylase-like metal-dependent hydrolase (beta-lactamase superfamily II)
MLDILRQATPAAGRIGTVINTHANGDHCYGNALVAGGVGRRRDRRRWSVCQAVMARGASSMVTWCWPILVMDSSER